MIATFYVPVKSNTETERARLKAPAGWEAEAAFMRRLHNEQPDLKTYTVVMPVPHPAFLGASQFYAAAYSRDPKTHITVEDKLRIVHGTAYVTCDARTLTLLKGRRAEILASSESGSCAAAKLR